MFLPTLSWKDVLKPSRLTVGFVIDEPRLVTTNDDLSMEYARQDVHSGNWVGASAFTNDLTILKDYRLQEKSLKEMESIREELKKTHCRPGKPADFTGVCQLVHMSFSPGDHLGPLGTAGSNTVVSEHCFGDMSPPYEGCSSRLIVTNNASLARLPWNSHAQKESNRNVLRHVRS